MKQSSSRSIKTGLLNLLKQLKVAARAEYSLSDFHPTKVCLCFQSMFSGYSRGSSANTGSRSWHTHLMIFLIQNQAFLIWIALVLAGFLLTLSVIAPYTMKAQNNLLLRPTQWTYLQNIVKESRFDSKSTGMIIKFDEVELERLRTILLNRGIHPSILSLSAGSMPSVELQANDVMFSTLLEVLDEMRNTWHLYPNELIIHNADSAGVVSVRSQFLQHSSGDFNSTNSMVAQ